jgi:hypothetical protein
VGELLCLSQSLEALPFCGVQGLGRRGSRRAERARFSRGKRHAQFSYLSHLSLPSSPSIARVLVVVCAAGLPLVVGAMAEPSAAPQQGMSLLPNDVVVALFAFKGQSQGVSPSVWPAGGPSSGLAAPRLPPPDASPTPALPAAPSFPPVRPTTPLLAKPSGPSLQERRTADAPAANGGRQLVFRQEQRRQARGHPHQLRGPCGCGFSPHAFPAVLGPLLSFPGASAPPFYRLTVALFMAGGARCHRTQGPNLATRCQWPIARGKLLVGGGGGVELGTDPRRGTPNNQSGPPHRRC